MQAGRAARLRTRGPFEDNTAPSGAAASFDPNQQAWATFTDTVFLENTSSASGAALDLGGWGSGGSVVFDGVTVHRNGAGAGSAAIDVDPDRTFESIACDLGTGADDNAPADAVSGTTVVHTGAAASFTLP